METQPETGTHALDEARARTRLRDLIYALSEDGTMPGVAVACGVRDRVAARVWAGDACRYGGPRRPVDEATLYDAASLTKIMCTVPVSLRLHEAGVTDLDEPVTTWLPDLATPYGGRMTVRHLLTHTAGLVPHREYWRTHHGYGAVLNAVLRETPAAPPGTICAYSDLGYILLGEILRRAARTDLPELFDTHVRAPLGLRATSFRPSSTNVAATEVRNGVAVQGHVHDENALAMGEVTGHAGLFTDLHDAAAYAAAWSTPALLPLSDVLTAQASRLQPLPDPSFRRGLGWVLSGDSTWDHVGPSWPATTISHTGFTGVSLAADPVSGWWAAVLSNAVHAGRERPRLRRARLDIHSAVARLLSADSHRPTTLPAVPAADSLRRTG
ncbi:serine hydrolase domain-containing protein [Streptomyces sp. NPDC047028]|uniref:serine hydrolase domain-containing protein n=1 Tax=Streptomyces sp. NPDC047028 TaxID=3155793 RepID=UPI0033DDE709